MFPKLLKFNEDHFSECYL